MRWRDTIIMMVLAGIAVLLALWMHEVDVDRPRHMESTPLVSSERLPRNEIDRIELHLDEASPLVFEREDDHWWMTQPFRHPAAHAAMHGLIDAVLSTRVVDRLELDDAVDLERLDLSPPRGSVIYHFNEDSVGVDLGNSGIGGRAYVRLQGDSEVLVVDDALQKKLLYDNPVQWREHALFPGVDIEVDRIERVIGDKHVVMERDGRHWRLTSPIQTRIDDEAMGLHMIELARARWVDVMLDQPEDLSSFGLDAPPARMEITRNGETRVLLVGDRLGGSDQDRSAMIEGVPAVLALDGRTVASILPDPATLIDLRASGLRPADIKTIEIHGPGGQFQLQRSLETWVAPDHDDQEVPSELVEELLHATTMLRATEVEIHDAYPNDLEQARITFLGYDGSPIDTVRLLREQEHSGRWAMENGDRVLRIHPEFLVLHLRPSDYGLNVSTEEAPLATP